MDEYIVYVRTNADGIIIAINSSAFMYDKTGWTEIDEGESDRYHHAQGNYLPLGLTDSNGIYNYKLIGNAAVTRSTEDKAAALSVLTTYCRHSEIMKRFTEIDQERIRPLAATATGTQTAYDTDKLTTLDEEAAALRIELASLQ